MFADVSFFCQKISLFGQKIAFTQINCVRAVLERFVSSVFSFCKIKGYCLGKYKLHRLCVRNPASGLLQIDRKLEKWQ